MKNRFNIEQIVLWVSSAAAGALWCIYIGDSTVKWYESVRTPLTAALIALVAATLACRTTWLPKLKEAYEGDEHSDNVEELRSHGRKLSYYGGFDRLASAFSVLSIIVVVTAALQLVVSARSTPVSVGSGFGTAAAVFMVFLYLLYRVRRIEISWIRKMEGEHEKKRSEKIAAVTH
jgi:hypothetical protein